jgi:hypothetical protein
LTGVAATDSPSRWTIHPATQEQDGELLALFAQVFGHEMPLPQWRWKYAEAPVRGLLLRREGMAVGFWGGMPRRMASPAGAVSAVQNGDVMVLAGESRVGRQGAMRQLCTAFLQEFVGPSRTYEFAFGFPNERAFRLGSNVGLYEPAGTLAELTWTPLAEAAPWRVRERVLTQDNLSAIELLWVAMQRDWPRHYIPTRDAARWQARFISHPVNRYEVVLLESRWTGRAVCALVLREEAGRVVWLDYVGPASAASLAVGAARRFSAQRGNKPLCAFFSDGIAPLFAADAAACNMAAIHVPVNTRPQGEVRPYVGHLWLMGGDTDFL